MHTKVNKLRELYNMQLHVATDIAKLLDNFIPRNYTSLIMERCREKDIPVSSSQAVIDVKLLRTKNTQVLGVLLEFARENKDAQEKLEAMAGK